MRKLIELHGGSVEARSEGRWRGSEFVVSLPVASAAPSEPAPAASATWEAQPDGQGLRILVVDDNRDAAESLQMLLSMEGHVVQIAHDGAAALATALSHKPDVVLLDLGLPGMDGYQVARRLRELEGLARVFLVAMTGYGQEEDRRRTEAAGFDHHVVKPADPVALQQLFSRARHIANASAPLAGTSSAS